MRKALKNKIKYFPYFCYFLICALTITIIITQGTGYWYDEMIVTSVSQQTLKELLQTILAEPHPPGLYLLLKFLPVENHIKTRIIISIIGSSLILLTAFYGEFSNIFEKHNLRWPFAFFLFTPLWLGHSVTIKQEMITIPLLILGHLFALNYLKTNKLFDFILINLIALICFFFGYINSIPLLIMLIALTMYNPSKNKNLITITTFVLISIYLALFGYKQFLINTSRFTWQKVEYLSLIHIFYYSLYNPKLISLKSFFLGDLLFLGTFYFFVKGLKNYNLENKVKKYLFIFFISYLLGGTLIAGIARPRYITWVIMFYIVISIQELTKLKLKRIKEIWFITCIFITFALSNSFGPILYNQRNLRYKEEALMLENLANGNPLGIIYRHPLEAHLIKRTYLKDSDYIKPINPFLEIGPEQTINKEFLEYEGKFQPKNANQLISYLKETNLEKYIYKVGTIKTWNNPDYYYDSEQMMLKTLNDFCNKKDLRYLANHKIILFEDCNKE